MPFLRCRALLLPAIIFVFISLVFHTDFVTALDDPDQVAVDLLLDKAFDPEFERSVRSEAAESALALARESNDLGLLYTALIGTVQFYTQTGQLNRCTEFLDQAIELESRPTDLPKIDMIRCRIFTIQKSLRNGDFIDAVECANKAMELAVGESGYQSRISNLKGVALNRLGAFGDAHTAFLESGELATGGQQRRIALTNLAFMLVRRGRLKEARQIYKTISPFNQDGRPFISRSLGVAELEIRVGNGERALALAREVLEKYPDLSDTGTRKGNTILMEAKALFAIGEIEEAAETINQALEALAPKANHRGEALTLKAEILLTMGKREEAIRFLKTAQTSQDLTYRADATNKLSQIYSENKQFEDAFEQQVLLAKLEQGMQKLELTNRLRVARMKYESEIKLSDLEMIANRERSRSRISELQLSRARESEEYSRASRNWVIGISSLIMFSLLVYGFLNASRRKAREALRDAEAVTKHQQQLARVERTDALSRLTSSVSHDFNNILQVLTQTNQLLEMSLAEPSARQRNLLLTAESSIETGASITRQLLTFARSGKGVPEHTRIQELCESSGRLFATVGGAVQLDIQHGDPKLAVMVDRLHFTNSVLNLLLNARDAMGGSGTVQIRTSRINVGDDVDDSGARFRNLSPGDYAAIEVADSGRGMTESEVSQAIEPFFTTKVGAERTGSGIGLNSVSSFLKNSGGRLDIASQPLVGTTVTMFLPCAETWKRSEPVSAATNEKPDSRERQSLVGYRCLLVEDQCVVRSALALLLEAEGTAVVEAENLQQAIDVLKESSEFDFVISDIQMNGDTDGLRLAHWVCENAPSIGIVLISGNDPPHGSDEFQFVNKPFSLVDLRACVGPAINEAKRRVE